MRKFSDHGCEALTGASTKHNARFIRLKWEVKAEAIGISAEQTRQGRGWVLTTRGGRFSRYYGDLDSVINWFNDGEQPKTFISEYYESRGWGYRWNAALNGHHRYFQAGLTWPLRGETISVRLVPRGGIPGFAGKMAYAPEHDLLWLLAITNSCVFDALVRLFAGKVSGVQYEAGLIQQIPLPDVTDEDREHLGGLALRAWSLRRALDTCAETSQVFTVPALLQVVGDSVTQRIAAWFKRIRADQAEVAAIHAAVDQCCFRLYGINEAERASMTESVSFPDVELDDNSSEDVEYESEDGEDTAGDEVRVAAEFVSWTIGVVFGRFDLRIAAQARSLSPDSEPFTALPVCAPGMLTQEDGFPAIQAPDDYPLRIDGDGIIVDDPTHTSDVVRRVDEVLEVIWKDRADTVEQEACQILGVKELRDYFRKPGKGGFWDDHVARYSKSRRKAPIYWLLQSARKNYAVWLYYHRLDKDILFKVLLNYVEPKLRLETDRLTQVRGQRTAASGKAAKQVDRDIERQDALVSELADFKDNLERAANLHLEPDLNDGVVLNIAPLHELVPWKEAKAYWDDLLAGKYEWSSIGKQLREKGLVR
jgi:hypothetical protein